MKIGIIIGSTRPNRQGHIHAKWVESFVEEAGHEATTLDLAEINLPFLNEPASPKQGNYQHEHTQKWAAIVGGLDAFIIVTPEYNHSYPAPLKNALDTLYAEWNHKPVGFVGYGVRGGARAIAHLRDVVAELKMQATSAEVCLLVFAQQDEQGHFVPNEGDQKAARAVVAELAELAE